MKILIIGSGGREHALAWKLAQDSRVKNIYLATGNAGTTFLENAENIALKTIPELLDFALKNKIDLTIVGSEALLVEGIVDKFSAAGLQIFGANQKAAQLEGSKRFSKDFMQRYGVKTAQYASFDDMQQALAYLEECSYPTVVKASGLAAGKGVVICQNKAEAKQTVIEMMQEKRFGDSGTEIVIEQFLQGFECSVLSFCDGKTIALMQSAKDHKTIGENNTGANTGGMGVVSPHPLFNQALQEKFQTDIVIPTLQGLQAEKMDFAGVIFFGLMIDGDDVYLLEYNMRMGDPETQAVLPLMENELLEPIFAALKRELSTSAFKFSDKHAVCVVAASQGYPEKYETDKIITGIEKASASATIFIAGAQKKNQQLLTSGGRVLNVVGLGNSLDEARNKAYQAMQDIDFSGKIYRRDIAL